MLPAKHLLTTLTANVMRIAYSICARKGWGGGGKNGEKKSSCSLRGIRSINIRQHARWPLHSIWITLFYSQSTVKVPLPAPSTQTYFSSKSGIWPQPPPPPPPTLKTNIVHPQHTLHISTWAIAEQKTISWGVTRKSKPDPLWNDFWTSLLG